MMILTKCMRREDNEIDKDGEFQHVTDKIFNSGLLHGELWQTQMYFLCIFERMDYKHLHVQQVLVSRMKCQ